MTQPAPLLDAAAAEAVLDAMAPLLGLTIDPAWRGAIVTNLKTVTAAARLVEAFALDDELEPAPVFSA